MNMQTVAYGFIIILAVSGYCPAEDAILKINRPDNANSRQHTRKNPNKIGTVKDDQEILTLHKDKPGTSGLLTGLQRITTPNILRNGDFTQKSFRMPIPLFWMPSYNSAIPEKCGNYSLEDGVLSFNAPYQIWQSNDITHEISVDYTLKFACMVKGGSLVCSVTYRSERYGGISKQLLSKVIKASENWCDHEFNCHLEPEYISGSIQVAFFAKGNGGKVSLRRIKLIPTLPKSLSGAKTVYLDNNGIACKIKGIMVAHDHDYYEMKAAKYLQKFIFTAFGRVIDIFLDNKTSTADKQGIICIGNSYIPANDLAQVKTGGYIIKLQKGALLVGGKEDGSIQGVFAILANLGIRFFSMFDFSHPFGNTIRFKRKNIINNPAFAYRHIINGTRAGPSRALLQESSADLVVSTQYIGMWVAPEHPLGALLDPFKYFKVHPEYYALTAKGTRSWESRINLNTSKFPESKKLMYMQVCLSNPEVQKIVAANAVKCLKACPHARFIRINFGDRYGYSNWCHCKRCRDYGPGNTDRWLRFINNVARIIKKQFPDKFIITIIYAETRNPPVGNVKLESNVIMEYCVTQGPWPCKRHFNCIRNQAGFKEYFGWLKWLSGTPIWVALYQPHPISGQISAFAERIRFFAAAGNTIGITSYLPDKNPWCRYIYSKLEWNPNLDVNKLLDNFMAGYYGPAADCMKKYINMIEIKEKELSLHQPNAIMVDYDFKCEAEKLLTRASELINDKTKLKEIRRYKMMLLKSYVENNNRASGLPGQRLDDFARTFAELLRLFKEFHVRVPKWKMDYRKYIKAYTFVDIGNTKPWYESPTVKKILDNPLTITGKSTKAYTKSTTGIYFDLRLFGGGEGVRKYQYQGIPRTKRGFAKILRRRTSPKSRIRTVFDLPEIPANGMLLQVEGLDDEKPGHADLKIMINEKPVFAGTNTFNEADWSTMKFSVPSAILHKGENTITLLNTTEDKPDEAVDEGTDGVIARDYKWGWMMISKIELHFNNSR